MQIIDFQANLDSGIIFIYIYRNVEFPVLICRCEIWTSNNEIIPIKNHNKSSGKKYKWYHKKGQKEN